MISWIGQWVIHHWERYHINEETDSITRNTFILRKRKGRKWDQAKRVEETLLLGRRSCAGTGSMSKADNWGRTQFIWFGRLGYQTFRGPGETMRRWIGGRSTHHSRRALGRMVLRATHFIHIDILVVAESGTLTWRTFGGYAVCARRRVQMVVLVEFGSYYFCQTNAGVVGCWRRRPSRHRNERRNGTQISRRIVAQLLKALTLILAYAFGIRYEADPLIARHQ